MFFLRRLDCYIARYRLTRNFLPILHLRALGSLCTIKPPVVKRKAAKKDKKRKERVTRRRRKVRARNRQRGKRLTHRTSGRRLWRDRRRRHRHWEVMIIYHDGKHFARIYTDRRRAERFAMRQKRSPVVRGARIREVNRDR